MLSDHLPHCPEDVRQRAARVRLACFDVDGTLTDGRLYFDDGGREMKAFHVVDGQGLVLLRKAGVRIAFVTARAGEVARRRAEELGAEGHVAVADKLACVVQIARRHGLSLDEVAFMGDDLPDLQVMQHVGLSAAPANAHPWVRAHARFVTRARGGEGAARELCDLLLVTQGHAERLFDALMGRESPA